MLKIYSENQKTIENLTTNLETLANFNVSSTSADFSKHIAELFDLYEFLILSDPEDLRFNEEEID